MTAIGFSGTQRGMTDQQRVAVQRLFLDLGAVTVHHGDCEGSDDQADDIARSVGCRIHIHPPTDPKKRAFCFQPGDTASPPRPYLERNKGIVDSTACLVAAPFEVEEQIRSGTWSTVRYARRRGKTVHLVFPNGTVRVLSGPQSAPTDE